MSEVCLQGYPLNTLITELPAEDYHAHPYISRSQVSGFIKAKSPRHYWWDYERPEREPFSPSPAMQFGTAFHDLILEPETFGLRNLFAPTGLGRRAKADKEKWVKLETEASELGAVIHKGEEESQLYLMRESIREFIPEISAPDGQSEVTIFFKCPTTGLGMKVRFDRLFVEQGIARDLKTTADDASADGFAKTSRKFRYDIQAAFYLRAARIAGFPLKRFIFDVVETKRGQFPGAKSHDLGQPIIDAATTELEEALARFAECKSSDFWPGYPDGVHLHSESETTQSVSKSILNEY